MFSSQYRLDNTEFLKVKKFGNRVQNTLFFGFFVKDQTKIAVTIPKKVHKLAIKRNLYKRKINHILKEYTENLKGYSIIIQPKVNLDSFTRDEIKNSLYEIIQKICRK